jgi:hypothetical protein
MCQVSNCVVASFSVLPSVIIVKYLQDTHVQECQWIDGRISGSYVAICWPIYNSLLRYLVHIYRLLSVGLYVIPYLDIWYLRCYLLVYIEFLTQISVGLYIIPYLDISVGLYIIPYLDICWPIYNSLLRYLLAYI